MIIDKPGVYTLTDAEYDADPCPLPSLRSSTAKVLIGRSPRHAWTKTPRLNPDFEPEEKEAFDIGDEFHSLLLRGLSNAVVVQEDSWRSDKAKTQRDAARAAGKNPLLAKHYARVEKMVLSVREQLAQHADDSSAFLEGVPEQTIIWREGDVWCRCRPDWTFATLGDHAVFYDAKSTENAEPNEMASGFTGIARLGYHYSAAFYLRGIRAVLGIKNPQFRLVCVEKKPPHAISVIGLSPAWLDEATADVEHAIETWGRCVASGQWPAYGNRTVYPDPPAYMATRAQERRYMRQWTAEQELRAAAEAQRPVE